MTKLILLLLNALIAFIHCCTCWHLDLPICSNATSWTFSMNLVLEFPQFDYSIIGWEHLQHTVFVINEFYCVYLFIQFNWFQMIKLWFMTLDLSEIPVIKVSGVFELVILENNDTTSLITYSKIFPSLIKFNSCQDIILGNIFLFTLSKSVNIHPVITVCHTIWVDLRLSNRLFW